MKVYCTNCGETIDETAKFCPSCGTALTDSVDRKTTDSEWSSTAKTAATVGGTVLGAYALSSLMRSLFRPRPRPFHPPHHHGPMGGPRGHGPGGRR